MIKVEENDPIGEMVPSFPYRDVAIKRGVDMKLHYDLEGEIGRGKFGTVYKCREKGTNLTLAAKFVGIAKRQDRKNVEREVEIMRTLQHPRLIQLYDAFETDNVMCVVLELIQGGELFERVIDDDFILTEKACTAFMRQICEGVNFIHRNNIIHLDLKPENILCLTKTGNRIKIIDFGLARKYEPDKKLQVLFGTPEFVAPEVVNFDQISCATDMWSVGVICYVLLSGLSPFMGETDVETMANVTIARYDFEDESFEEISTEAKDFISKLLLKEKEARLTAEECLSHPWLRRKIPPPPPSLDNTKENLRIYVEKTVPVIKHSIIIENKSKEKVGVIEKLIENEHKNIYPNITSPSTNEMSVMKNSNLLDIFKCKKDISQLMEGKAIIIENEINSQKGDQIMNHSIECNNTKSKDADGIPPVKNKLVRDDILNINSMLYKELNSAKVDESKRINCTFAQGNNKKKDNNTDLAEMNSNPQDIQAKNHEINRNAGKIKENVISETNFQIEKHFKDSATLKNEILMVNNVSSSFYDHYSTAIKRDKIRAEDSNKKIGEHLSTCQSFWKMQANDSKFQKALNFSTSLSPPSITQKSEVNSHLTINNFQENPSGENFDSSKIPNSVKKSSIKYRESNNSPASNFNDTINFTKTKDSQPLPFKQHLRSNPPWFSELNNHQLNKPITELSERRSSDFSCFLNSKDDSESLNLADEIRKLSARLLQMSGNHNESISSYTTSNLNFRVRNDPITCFLENHGIQHPRPKYKFSNLNRDVPIGSPPPPSNLAYYLNVASNLNRKDSHSAPGSPRISPERKKNNKNITSQTSGDISSINIGGGGSSTRHE